MQINGKAIQQYTSIQSKEVSKEQSTNKIPLARKLVDLLFVRFESIYGHLWTSRHSDPKAWDITKDEWGGALANVELHVIRKVLDDLRSNGDQFPPALPLFLKMCRQHSGIPDMDLAYQMALRRDFSHPIAQICFHAVGSWDFTHDSEKVLRQKFLRAYNQAVKEIPISQKMLESTR